jgi:hypothetical protein
MGLLDSVMRSIENYIDNYNIVEDYNKYKNDGYNCLVYDHGDWYINSFVEKKEKVKKEYIEDYNREIILRFISLRHKLGKDSITKIGAKYNLIGDEYKTTWEQVLSVRSNCELKDYGQLCYSLLTKSKKSKKSKHR